MGVSMTGCLDEGLAAEATPVDLEETFQILDASGDAPDFLDVLSGRFIETEDVLVVEFQVQSFDPKGVVSTLAAEDFGAAGIRLCWNPTQNTRGDTYGLECAGIRVERAEKNPVVGHYSISYGPTGGCNDWYWCEWHVPHVIEGTNPTTIRVSVPRELLPNSSLGHELETPFLESRATRGDATNPFSMTGHRGWANVCAVTCAGHNLAPVVTFMVDEAKSAPSYELRMETRGTLGAPAPRTILYDSEGEWMGVEGYSPALDVVSVDIEETSSHVAYVVKVASLPLAPTHDFDMELAVEGITYEAWYSARAGVVNGAAMGYCASRTCETWRQTPVEVKFQPGTPGTIRVELPWADMASPKAGSLITLAEAEIGEPGHYQAVPLPVGGAWANVGGEWDSAWFVEPYYLKIGSGQ